MAIDDRVKVLEQQVVILANSLVILANSLYALTQDAQKKEARIIALEQDIKRRVETLAPENFK